MWAGGNAVLAVNISKLQDLSLSHAHTHTITSALWDRFRHCLCIQSQTHTDTHYNNTISQFPLPLVPPYIIWLTHCCFVSPPLPSLIFFFFSFSQCINQIPNGRSKLFISFAGCLSLIAMSSSFFASHNWIKGILIFSLHLNKSKRIFLSETLHNGGMLSKALLKTQWAALLSMAYIKHMLTETRDSLFKKEQFVIIYSPCMPFFILLKTK